ncbi:hypothetical protein CPB84DRAFT_246188 [Gymnopilus junonius]|uniref:Uncharacterized protein n=1 Tax=Gymnopilus junonius TaxID=109634 RepID=A0A9P5NXM6_GYMJU|nr:hypothetical protein CPB84DRAFT_246188 [Gymnopilus junonius]
MDVSMSGESSAYNAKDEMARSGGWLPRDAARPRPDRGYDSERAITPRPQVSGGSTNESRSLAPPGRRAGLPADDRDTDRPRKEGWLGYDTQLDYERPGDVKPMHGISGEHGQAPARSAPSEAPLSIDARRASEVPPPAGDIRPPVDSRPPPDARAPARTAERTPAENNEDIGSSRSSSVRPPEAPVPPSLGPVPSAAPANDLVIEPPSLKDRLNIPPSLPSRRENEAPPAADEQQHQHPPASHGRSGKPQKFQKDRGSGYNGGPSFVRCTPQGRRPWLPQASYTSRSSVCIGRRIWSTSPQF